MLCVWWAPCSRVVSSCGMLYLDDFRSVLQPIFSGLSRQTSSIGPLGLSILDLTGPTQGLPIFAYNMAAARKSERTQNLFSQMETLLSLTPAKTRVMSSTRIPAKGRVGESTGAAVAKPRRRELLEPLSRFNGREHRHSHSEDRNTLMMP